MIRKGEIVVRCARKDGMFQGFKTEPRRELGRFDERMGSRISGLFKNELTVSIALSPDDERITW